MTRASAFTLQDMKTLLKSRYPTKTKGRNDKIEKNMGGVTYYLFGIPFVHYDPTKKTLRLSDEGYQTNTTKDTINTLLRSAKSDLWYFPEKRRFVY